MRRRKPAGQFLGVLILMLPGCVGPEGYTQSIPEPSVRACQTPLKKPVRSQGTSTPKIASGRSSSVPDSTMTFENVAAASGIDFILKNSVSPIRYYFETMIGGAAAFDYNNDGYLDIYFPNGASIPALEKADSSFYNRLFRNNGDGTFSDVAMKAGVQGIGYSMGVATGDYDNDGFVDLYVCGVNNNQLFHNNGDGTFSDITLKAGVPGIHPKFGKTWAITAGWFDYNNDGRFDLFVNNYLQYSVATAPHCTMQNLPAYCSPTNFEGLPNFLYRNNGDGTFTDVSEESQIGRHYGKGMGMAFADYDNDGWMDIFISNDTFRNFLFHNKGDGTFEEVAMTTFVAYNENGKTVAGMGADFRDLNNDGKPEIFHTAMFADTFPLYKNLGAQFEDVTRASGITIPSSGLTAWGTGLFDFDNDGYKDIFAACSAILDNSMEIQHLPFLLPNAIFRNNGDFTFANIASRAGSAILVPAAHRGAAFGDFNNDGKVDAVVVVLNARPELLLNRTANKNHWLLINLVGAISNRDGLGTRIKITTGRGVQFNQATTTVSYNSASDKRVHFGLGDADIVDKIELTWPSGVRQELNNIKADQILLVQEPGQGREIIHK